MVQSKFTKRAYSIFLVLFSLLTAIIICAYAYESAEKESHKILYLLSIALLLFLVIMITRTELKNKMVKLILSEQHVTVIRYAGLFQKEQIFFNKIDGYITERIESESSSSEFFFLIQKGKKIIALSEFYHKNYTELKSSLQQKVKKL